MATPPPPVRLTEPEIGIVAALAATPGHDLLGRPEARAVLDRLAARGLLAGAALVEPLATIARTIARPSVRVEVRVRRPDGVAEHRGWADADRAVVGDVGPADTRLALVAWAAFPAALAARTGLSDAVAPPDGATPVAVTAELEDGTWRAAWEITASWRDGGEDVPHFLRVLDRGDAGLWRVEGRPVGVELVPATPPEVERALVGLLP